MNKSKNILNLPDKQYRAIVKDANEKGQKMQREFMKKKPKNPYKIGDEVEFVSNLGRGIRKLRTQKDLDEMYSHYLAYLEYEKNTMSSTIEEAEMTIHAILAGVLMNGFIQGQTKEKLNSSVLAEANKEVFKAIKQSAKTIIKNNTDSFGQTDPKGIANDLIKITEGK